MQQEELSLAIQQVCEEKGLTPEDVKATIQDALAAAYRKDFGDKRTQNIRVEFELSTGDFKVFDVKEVVEDELKEKYEKLKEEIEKLKAEGKNVTPEIMEKIQDKIEKEKGSKKKTKEKEKKTNQGAEDGEEEKKFNPRTMIALSDAKKIKKSYKVGDEVITKLEVPAAFGRMAAQTAKQVIIQKLREAERDVIYNEYKEKIGELVIGTVQRQEGRVVLVDLGNTSAVMLPVDQIKTDKYQPGNRMKFYIKSVEQTNKGPEIMVSRSHPEILRKLFKLEVPEINSGIVVIKSIARDAGARSKIAVMAKEEGLDPIGACIGQRGTRVQTIINELGGEKIDIIEWDENINKFIENALAPAKILEIKIDSENKTAKAYVKEDQYSLAIGKGGQNVRLAAQLVGMKIDVIMEKSEENAKEQKTEAEQENGKGKEKTGAAKDTEKSKKIKKEEKEIKAEKQEDKPSKNQEDKKEESNKKEAKKIESDSGQASAVGKQTKEVKEHKKDNPGAADKSKTTETKAE